MSFSRSWLPLSAMMALLAAAALTGCGGGDASSSVPAEWSQPVAGTGSQGAWKHDPRCSLEKLVTVEVTWMDDGTIPDNAQNESSAHVLAEITKAEKQGGSCDDVRARLLQALQ